MFRQRSGHVIRLSAIDTCNAMVYTAYPNVSQARGLNPEPSACGTLSCQSVPPNSYSALWSPANTFSLPPYTPPPPSHACPRREPCQCPAPTNPASCHDSCAHDGTTALQRLPLPNDVLPEPGERGSMSQADTPYGAHTCEEPVALQPDKHNTAQHHRDS